LRASSQVCGYESFPLRQAPTKTADNFRSRRGQFPLGILMCGTIVIGIGAVVQILMPLAQRFGDTIGGTLYGAGPTLVATELMMIKERADSRRKHNELLRKSEAIGASAEGLGANFRGFALDVGMLFAQAVGGKKMSARLAFL
jgi:hypothetical protein